MSTLKTHNLQSPDAGSVNIVMAPNAGMVVAGLSTYSNQINVGSNIKLGNAGVVTATSFVGSGANLTGITQTTINNNADNRVITGSGTANTLNGESGLTYNGSTILTISGSGQQQLNIGSTNAGGALIVLDGDSNGDGAGGDYSFIRHGTDGNLEFFARNTGGATSTIFKQGTSEKFRIDSNGNLSLAGDTDTYIHHPEDNEIAITVSGGSFPIARFGTGGNNGTVGLSTDSNLVTSGEILSVRGYSSFKSPSNVYAAIYTHNEGNTSNTYNAHLLWNAGGANRGGIGYMPNTGEVVINNQNALNFATGATHLGGTTRFRIDNSGNIKIGGHTFNRDMGGLSVQRLHIEGTDGGSSAIGIFNNQNSGGSAGLYLGKSRGTSLGSDTIVQDNDPLGSIVWVGADGNDAISQGATIQAKVDGTPGSNDMPTRLEFATTADGNATVTNRMTVHEDGMLSLRNHGNSKTYFFSSGVNGGYSSVSVVIDCHAYHCFVIQFSLSGYHSAWASAIFQGYENAGMYYANEGPYNTTDSNSHSITHSHDGGHKHKILSNFAGTHPICELRITIGGDDAYIDSRDITWTWS